MCHDVGHGPYRLLPVRVVNEKLCEGMVVLPFQVNVLFENVKSKVHRKEIGFRSMLVSCTLTPRGLLHE